MHRIVLLAGGLLNLLLAIFKIAMPHLFYWRESMSSSAAHMWSTLYAENLALSLLLLSFAYMSIFQWEELVKTGLGKTALLSIGSLWIFRIVAEFVLFRIGVDGAWWRVILFMTVAACYLLPLASAVGSNQENEKSKMTQQLIEENHE